VVRDHTLGAARLPSGPHCTPAGVAAGSTRSKKVAGVMAEHNQAGLAETKCAVISDCRLENERGCLHGQNVGRTRRAGEEASRRRCAGHCSLAGLDTADSFDLVLDGVPLLRRTCLGRTL
jgi:hypothetical protein